MTHDALDLRPLRLTLLLALGLTAAACGDKPDDDDDDDETGSTDDTATGSSLCVESTPVLSDAGTPTGIERCADGSLHRASAEAADPGLDGVEACQGDEDFASCSTDAECTEGRFGKCAHRNDYDGEGGTGCGCVYACETDADCVDGRACIPDGIVETGKDYSTCIRASCETDADCDSSECGLSSWNDGCGWSPSLSCRVLDDDCRVDSDCDDRASCVGGRDGDVYTCRTTECDIGRPLLVDGEGRIAQSTARGDWQAALAPELPRDPGARQALAERWARIGALEHASVASFARFTLQMMALGAPADLLRDIQAAALDEVRHAELAYGLASAFAGAPVGPGPLDLSGAAPSLEPAHVVAALVAEACVGETIGAAEAADKASKASDPVVAGVLLEIARDETRHAALAWRSLQWLLEQHTDTRGAAADALEMALSDLGAERSDATLRARIVRQVVRPTASALGLGQAGLETAEAAPAWRAPISSMAARG
jgi:hypothetical protein